MPLGPGRLSPRKIQKLSFLFSTVFQMLIGTISAHDILLPKIITSLFKLFINEIVIANI